MARSLNFDLARRAAGQAGRAGMSATPRPEISVSASLLAQQNVRTRESHFRLGAQRVRRYFTPDQIRTWLLTAAVSGMLVWFWFAAFKDMAQ